MNPISVWGFQTKAIALGLIITALGAFHYYDRYEYAKRLVNASETRLNASYTMSLNQKIKETRDKEDKLRTSADQQLKDKDEKIKTIDGLLVAANNELLKRSKRPSTITNTASPSIEQTCTGRELYQEDGQFLAGEAARAEKLITERDYYYEQYETARKILDGTP